MFGLIKYQENHLLNGKQFETLLTSIYPDEKGQLVGNILSNYILIVLTDTEKSLYEFNLKSITYTKQIYDADRILTYITNFLSQSFENLKVKDKNYYDTLIQKYPKQYQSAFKNSSVNTYLPQIKCYIVIKENKFNEPHNDEIHFKNGYFNFKTNQFLPRVIKKHYITHFINRNFNETSNDKKAEVFKDIKKIYTKQDDLDYLLQTFAIALTGNSGNIQTILFLLGLGSSGKSTILDLLKLCCEKYVYSLPTELFSIGYSGKDKVLNSFLKNPHIRISHINEPSDKQFNGELFKVLADGNCQTISLYKEGSNDFSHYSKMVLTANNYPDINMDSGIERRIDSYTHQSKFVKDKDFVDEEKKIYLCNENFLTEKKQDEDYLNALFSILTEYYWKQAKDENDKNKEIIKYTATENFQNTKNEIVMVNNPFEDFIDKHLQFTNNNKDKVYKEKMLELYQEHQNNNRITFKDLSKLFQKKSFDIYNCNIRNRDGGVRGAFVGVKIKEDYDDDDDDDDINPQEKLYPKLTELKEIKNENQELKDEIERLKKMLLQKKETQMKDNKEVMKPKVKEITICEMLDDSNINENPDDIEEDNVSVSSISSSDDNSDNSNEFELMRQKTIAENKKIKEKLKQQETTNNEDTKQVKKKTKPKKVMYHKDYTPHLKMNEAVDDIDNIDDIVNDIYNM